MSSIVPFVCGTACAILGEFTRFITPDHDQQILLKILLWVVGLPSFIATVALPWFLIQRGYGDSDERVPPKSATGRKLKRHINRDLDD